MGENLVKNVGADPTPREGEIEWLEGRAEEMEGLLDRDSRMERAEVLLALWGWGGCCHTPVRRPQRQVRRR